MITLQLKFYKNFHINFDRCCNVESTFNKINVSSNQDHNHPPARSTVHLIHSRGETRNGKDLQIQESTHF